MKLNPLLRVALLIVSVYGSGGNLLARDKPIPEAAALLAHAANNSDIRSPGITPFRLRARVRVWGLKGAPLQGTYELSWNSNAQWRENIEFSDYRRVRVGGEGKYWQQRTVPFEPVRVYQFTRLLDFLSRLRPSQEDALGKVRVRKKKGVRMNCAIVQSKRKFESELCFDAATGALLREEYPNGHSFGQRDIMAHEYSQFILWDGKTFPGMLRAIGGEGTIAEIQVEGIETHPNPDASMFVPPVDSEEWAWCEKPELATVVERKFPRYPENAKMSRTTGTVSVYVLIGSDGRPSNLSVVRSAGPSLDSSALEVLPHWRFRPTTCNGVAVRDETVIDVIYTIR